MANSGDSVKRPYRSPLRERQAQATQQAIVDAAARLFAQRGYVATSVEEIAAEAGVSRATVFSSAGGKPELLKLAYRMLVRGADPDTPLGEQRVSREIQAEPDAAVLLERYADTMVGVGARLSSLYEAVRAAAHADAEARALWDLLCDERRTGAGRVVAAVQERGALAPGLDARTAGDILWVLNDPGVYHQLVERRGWSRRRFRAWLARAMQSELLGPTPREPGPDAPAPTGA